MSWDIFVQDIPADTKSPADIPDDFQPRPIGTRSAIIEKIQAVVPIADFTDPAWGRIESPDFSIEVNIGEEEEEDGFAFHVRGGDMAASVVADILQALGLRAFDPSSESGMFSCGPECAEGMRRWREYRDRVLKG